MRARGTIRASQRKTNLSNVFIFFLKTEEKILSFFHSINIPENCYLFVLTEFSVITLDPGILSKYHILKAGWAYKIKLNRKYRKSII